jgi:hypothetical protein
MYKVFERLQKRNFHVNFISHYFSKGFTMNKLSSKIKFFLSRADSRTVRLIVTLLSLVLFVLAAGAPDGMGGIGMQ